MVAVSMHSSANGEIQYEIMDLLRFPGIPASLDCSTTASANASNSRFTSHEDLTWSGEPPPWAGVTTETDTSGTAVVI
ncbi:hypothetical protein OGATHE_005006 [Ogataea polymorpha]|uniref:Uncharacterized protein n=1 Tax=Ogataea polymorpha TaxID=460523 RepID=A0A9P8NX38_9ASCO|nr:hypothetical protein OGATHE_005006 [Ogataea polymorpha]